ncbi:unnamed protein product [marine sediment metagenome]|uniref:Uncharacterized protein n=1 Tax=marine sediment metagenome TaxID=412755 RepID=X1RUJ2_9ZZZZ
MTIATQHPTLALEVSKYPVYSQAEAFLRKFLGRWPGWSSKNHRYAKCQLSASLDIIVVRLAPHIYEVRAYPTGALMVGDLEEALAIEDYRGWIIVSIPHTKKIKFIFSTQVKGIEVYRLVRADIRHKGTLARAENYYRKLI